MYLEKDMFKGKTDKEIAQYLYLELVDEGKKMQLSKIDFAGLEEKANETLRGLDDIYMNAHNLSSEDNYEEFMDFLDSISKARSNVMKGKELCQYMQSNFEQNLQYIKDNIIDNTDLEDTKETINKCFSCIIEIGNRNIEMAKKTEEYMDFIKEAA